MKYNHVVSTFGSVMPNTQNLDAATHTYGFNGQLLDNEISGNGNSLDFGARIYNPRLGRFLSIDPQVKNYPYSTPYSFAGNNPIAYIDAQGENPLFFVALFFIGTLADAALQYGINYAIYEDPTIAFKEIDWFDATLTGVATASTGGAGGFAKLELTLGKNLAKTVGKRVTAGELIEASIDVTAEDGIKFAGITKEGKEVVLDLSTMLMSKKFRNAVMNKMKNSSQKGIDRIVEKNTLSPDLRTPYYTVDGVVNSDAFDKFFDMLESGGEQLINDGLKQVTQPPSSGSDAGYQQFDITKGTTLEYQLQNGATRIDNTRVNIQGAGATLNGIKNLFKAKPPVREVYHSVRFL